jgi:hypothetical protein
MIEGEGEIERDRENDWLFAVKRPAQEYFTYLETSPLQVKGCKILAFARHSGPLSREAKFWPLLGTQGLWAGRYLYRATPVVTWDLGFSKFRSHP